MFSKVFGVILVLLTLDCFGSSFEIQPKIVNGSASKRGQFPFYVLLHVVKTFDLNVFFICGGSLLNEEYVLTAAHCLHDTVGVRAHLGSLEQVEPEKFLTFSDFVDLETGRRMILTTPKHYIIHPHFNEETKANDIALIKLPQRAVYSDVIQPISFPNVCEMPVDKELIAIGNGKNGTIGMEPDIQQYTELVSISHESCRNVFKFIEERTVFCAEGYEKSSNSICFGDSGGPIIDPIENTIFGVGSFVNDVTGCDGGPQGFTNVIKFMPWIFEVTGIQVKNCQPTNFNFQSKL